MIKDKLKSSTTLAIVVFTMLFLTVNTILRFMGMEVDYMGSLVEKSFWILMLYIGGEKGKNIAEKFKK